MMTFAKLTQPYENIPAGYRVKLLDNNMCQVFTQGQIKELPIPQEYLEPIENTTPNQAPPVPVIKVPYTHTTFTKTAQGPVFTDEGVTVSCRCGNITRKVLSSSIRRFEYERAAINSVIAMCSICSPR